MTVLCIRRLLIDLETPFERHWCAGDPFRSALFNASSMSFPVGEQFFIDAVRAGLQALPVDQQTQWASEVQGFIGQEATHRRLHALFNRQLERQGLINHWAVRATRRIELMQGTDPRHGLAITAATEHFTAIFAQWLLTHPQVLTGSEDRLQTLWLWHSAEESEHKSTAVDLYRALGGNEAWRLTWFRRVTWFFVTDTMRQTLNNLWHDGTLWQWRTWSSAVRTLLGRDGLVRCTYSAWRAYKRANFHPNEQTSNLSERWLQANRHLYDEVPA